MENSLNGGLKGIQTNGQSKACQFLKGKLRNFVKQNYVKVRIRSSIYVNRYGVYLRISLIHRMSKMIGELLVLKGDANPVIKV